MVDDDDPFIGDWWSIFSGAIRDWAEAQRVKFSCCVTVPSNLTINFCLSISRTDRSSQFVISRVASWFLLLSDRHYIPIQLVPPINQGTAEHPR